MKRFFLTVCLLVNFSWLMAQHHVCGVTTDDQHDMISFIEAFNKTSDAQVRSADPQYVPVKFHMVAKNDGTGRIKAKEVIQQMGVLIEDFKAADMYLYIADYSFDYLNSEPIYMNASSFENLTVSKKDNTAMNIFITENADNPGGQGTTLGYYSPSGDYIIIRITDVTNSTTSLTHEIGHFFSLPHTFFGWEGGWNPALFNGQVNILTAPGTSIPVELVDGSNCTVAADRICDTPPDYNFGFGWDDCDYDEGTLDRNGDLIDPMEANFMSYFLDGCQDTYTQGQIDVMRANFLSNSRSYIRSTFKPDTTHIVSDHNLEFPTSGQKLDYYDQVLLDWSDAEGASHYLVSITSSGESYEIIVEDSEYLATELSPNKFYFWEVLPFNDGFCSTESKSSFFTSGTALVSTKESEILSSVNVFPNPVQSGYQVSLEIESQSAINATLTLIDITGTTAHKEALSIRNGNNKVNVNTARLSAGIYIMKIETVDGSVFKKLVIQ